jgi:hypothetical protein
VVFQAFFQLYSDPFTFSRLGNVAKTFFIFLSVSASSPNINYLFLCFSSFSSACSSVLNSWKTFYLKENGKLKTESGAKNNSQLPKGWEVKKLGEVCGFQNGFAFKSKTWLGFGMI